MLQGEVAQASFYREVIIQKIIHQIKLPQRSYVTDRQYGVFSLVFEVMLLEAFP